MTWPTVATKVNLDQASDDPKQARSELATLVDKFNQVQGQFTGISISAETRADVVTTTIASDVNVITTGGYTTAGDGGGATYKRGSEPSHALKIQSSDGAWWELVPNNGFISFQACGGIDGDDSANGAANVTAFNIFIVFAQTFFLNNNTAAPTLFFPIGYYHFNTHLNVKASCHIIGEGGFNFIANAGSVMEFPLDSYGLIFHTKGTIDITTEADTFHSMGSSIQRMYILGGGNTGTTGSGIWMRAGVTVRDCFISNFAEDGIRVLAQVATGNNAEKGDANLWYIDGATCTINGGNGLFVELNDANAGNCVRGNFNRNGRWGIHEASGLGNTYVGCHVAGNGLESDGGNPAGGSSFVTFDSNRYSAHVDASEADLVATTPGTDETIWILAGPGGTGSGIPLWLASQSAGTYFHGGGYRTRTASNRSVFIGCYAEFAEGVSQIQAPSMFIGGQLAGMRGSGFQIKGVSPFGVDMIGKIGFSNDETNFEGFDRALSLNINNGKNNLIRALADGDHSQGLQLLHWNEVDKMYIMCLHANLNARRPMWITTDLSTQTWGRASAIPGGSIAFPVGVWIGGSVSGARMHSNGTVAPTTGERARGDIVWNQNMTVGQPIGWACTVAGTPGTWVAMVNL